MHHRAVDIGSITRRNVIRKLALFGTGCLAAGAWRHFGGRAPATRFPPDGFHLLAFGDFGTGNEHQRTVAARMAEFANALDAPLAGVLALGDNFYRELTPERFNSHFEAMYPMKDLPCPFYALLGNHDYGPKYDSGQGVRKAQMQLDYARYNPTSRWKMPAKWYTLELPSPAQPLVKIICLDTNLFEGAITPQEKLAQQRFLEMELRRQPRAPWLWVAGHHPMFSNSHEGDNATMIRWLSAPLLKGNVSMYLCAHDHGLQHVEVPTYRASFVVSGGGGASLHRLNRADRGFAKRILGFNHLYVTSDKVEVQYINGDGNCLHAFRRTRDGQIQIIDPA